jgi:probable F420-dependent oxidoreductase
MASGIEREMVIDGHFLVSDLREAPAFALSSQRAGFDAMWTTEGQYDSYLPIAASIPQVDGLKFGTAVSLAFTRSPMTTAYLAWALQHGSRGRFMLGLGSQVKAHLERRFSIMGFEHPKARMVEIMQALRAIWDHWQNGTPLDFQGKFYQFTLMIPFMNPGPIEHPNIPIYLGAIGGLMAEGAGMEADGIMMHALHTPRYISEISLPQMSEGAKKVGRDPESVKRALNVLVGTGRTTEEMHAGREEVRRFISFYGSTKAYRGVLDLHGWGDTADKLRILAREKRWEEMPPLVNEEMMQTIGVIGEPDEIKPMLEARYRGLVDRIIVYQPYLMEQEGLWKLVNRV